MRSMAEQAPQFKVPPQSIESEQALLGSIMLKPDLFDEVVDIVPYANAFYSQKHRRIYEAMLELYSKTEPIDFLSLSNRLKEKDELEHIGGSSYLSELLNTVPTAANAYHYAKVVQKRFMMRSVIEAAEHIAELGYDESRDLEELLDEVEKKIYETTNTHTSHQFIALNKTLESAFERIDNLTNSSSALRGIATGFRSVDNVLAGLQNSDMVILAARPSMGKTALALDMARQSALQHGTRVGIFSLEMSTEQLVDRLFAAQSHVDAWKLRTGKNITEDDFTNIREAISQLSDVPIHISDEPGMNIRGMRSAARKLKSQHGLDMIIVDYLQMMQPTDTKASDSAVQQVTEISRSLKNLARELNVPVLALSQLSRAVEQRGGEPRLSDLRDSGSIEQDADVVLFIHQDKEQMQEEEDKSAPRDAKVIIAKHRNGPVGEVGLKFMPRQATFLELEKSDFGGFEEAAAGTAAADDDFF
jgi:replicative DNA helicase